MENKINIAELLRNCPKGMELDCINYNGVVTFEEIFNCPDYPIKISVKYNNEYFTHTLTKYGQTCKSPYNKCVIFPKGKTTWEGFQRPFKDGDIVVDDIFPFIYKNCDKTEMVKSYCGIDTKGNFWKESNRWTTLDKITFATEEQKEKLFKAIKDNGYRWNPETKTLEKLIEPKFKIEKGKWYVCIKDLLDNYANKAFCKGNTYLSTQDGSLIPSNSNVPFKVVCASTYFRELPKFKIGDRIRHKNDKTIIKTIDYIYHDSYALCDGHLLYFKEQDQYELVTDKFDFNTLVPFESRVLVRDNYYDSWKPSFWGYLRESEFMYDTIRGVFRQCIPYENNEHLMNTADDCADFYKTWENR